MRQFSLVIASTGLIIEKEPLTFFDVLSTGFILCGVTLVSCFGPSAALDPTLEQVMRFFSNVVFAAFASFSLLVILSWVGINAQLSQVRRRQLVGRMAGESEGQGVSYIGTRLSELCAGSTAHTVRGG